jgi:hypothetical protein
MNKIFFGIHTSLLLLLCALLACCSQDEEEYASAVPLDISAVIDGIGTRADATEKTAFENGDEITITIDGDDSGKSYIYVYDGSNWNPKNDDNRLLISEDYKGGSSLYLSAEYGAVKDTNYPLSLDALKKHLTAEYYVDYNTPKAYFTFYHKECMFRIFLKGDFSNVSAMNIKIDVSATNIGGLSGMLFSGTFNLDSYMNEIAEYGNPQEPLYITAAYLPATTDHIYFYVEAYDKSNKLHLQNYSINLFDQYKIEAGKSYTCFINFKLDTSE